MGKGERMAILHIYPKNGISYTFALTEERTPIGRAADNLLSLPDQFCSGRHALIAAAGEGYVIRDLGSKNGVFVNGLRIHDETSLKKGDEILLGSTRIAFDQESPTRVELVEGTQRPGDFNSILQVRDFLKKPSSDGKAPAPGAPPDLDRLQREQKVLTVLTEVSQALIYHMPLDQLLNHIMDLLILNIPMDSGVLMLKEGHPEQIVPKVVRVMNPELKNRNIQVSRSILNTALAKNSSILLSDVQSDSFFKEQASVVHSKIRSVMCVPLWNNEEIIGVVYADRASLLNQFTEDDLKLMTLLANLAAVKIENARLIEQALEKCRMDRELALAAQIQRNLLPKGSPDLESFEVCGRNRGCYEIGGDYYDFIPIAPGRLGIAIADVSGCGVGPALLMASLRASLHAEINPGYNLTGLAARLNGFVHQSSESHTFITFFFGELDTRTGNLDYVNAGHNPPIVLDGADGVRRLESTGFCLGMFPDVSYESGTIRLEVGDIACLFTDGITESRDPGKKEFGEERLTTLVRAKRGLPVAQIMDAIFEDVRGFTDGCEPGDDMTLVLIRRTK
jgi:phosphoserine phosphatase RsbU/P